MNTKQAKDFLVQKTAEQAALEFVSLSDPEKEMMYFTELDSSSCENPSALNEEFDSSYDSAEYEAKLSGLLHHAYQRLKSENATELRTWDQAMRVLRKGDHYLLVLWNIQPARKLWSRDYFNLLCCALLIVVVIALAGFASAKYNITWVRFHAYLPAPTPLRELILFVSLFLLALGAFRPFNWVMDTWIKWQSKPEK